MNKIWVSQPEVYKAIERDLGYRGRQHITGWFYSGDDEIVFDTNRKGVCGEHYTLIDFVSAMCKQIPAVHVAKCNQVGFAYKTNKDGTPKLEYGMFFFYNDEKIK